ncbi:predicted protein [Chaetomium globosum CBS 148.51]|uniref:Uncharacterized protein n=1 Tax=Chaetomium globosum (strain ATCC 6205 / CBS 148.51 / DSM 1962 / NBRC 6347 / NRRL 1970) TaxID=306901 RepID=Q2HCH5_CHAGB|nr:uncharacterized protein CHGG_02079 [Chaetomium globosum CBS 148.51]EAQ93844.1 predicted protein [Chaetomium globosum CBS 148.51]
MAASQRVHGKAVAIAVCDMEAQRQRTSGWVSLGRHCNENGIDQTEPVNAWHVNGQRKTPEVNRVVEGLKMYLEVFCCTLPTPCGFPMPKRIVSEGHNAYLSRTGSSAFGMIGGVARTTRHGARYMLNGAQRASA